MESLFSLAITLSLLCAVHLNPCTGSRILIQEPASTQFIRTSCSGTMYPALCFSSLSCYASTIQTSPMQLAHTSLSVTLDGARSTSDAMKVMSSSGGMSPLMAGAMKDCMDNVRDSINELKQSMDAMGHLRGNDLRFQLNSIQTWVSAALTDDDTCMNGFSASAMDGKVKTDVRSHVLNVAQLTSNSLAFINAVVVSSQSSAP